MAYPNKHNVQLHTDLLNTSISNKRNIFDQASVIGVPDSRFFFCNDLDVKDIKAPSSAFPGMEINRKVPRIIKYRFRNKSNVMERKHLSVVRADFSINRFLFQPIRFRVPAEFRLGVSWIDKNDDVQFFYDSPYSNHLENTKRDWWGYFCMNFEPTDPIDLENSSREITSEKKVLQPSLQRQASDSKPYHLITKSELKKIDDERKMNFQNAHNTGGYLKGFSKSRSLSFASNSFTQCYSFLFAGCNTKFIPVYKFRQHYFIPTISMNETISFYAIEHKDSLRKVIQGLRQFTKVPNPKDLGIGVMGQIYSDNILAIDYYKDAKVVPNR